MINKTQLKDLIDSTLKEYNLYSPEAAQLVYGTIIQESRRGTFIRQNVKNFDITKHAIGIAQIEYNTFIWLKRVFMSKYPEIAQIKFEELEYNLKYSILFCRLRYRVDKEPIPLTLDGQAEYWKRIYNTKYGKGTAKDYLFNFQKYA